MASHSAEDAAAELLTRILDRFDPTAFDVPRRRSRVRLTVRDAHGAEVSWDALLEPGSVALVPSGGRGVPDAQMAADLRTWRRIAQDLRAGLPEYRAGRLTIRRNLHLAIGLLAATAAREPGRLEVHSIATAHGHVSSLSAGHGEPVVMVHGLGATKASFLPTIRALAPSHRAIAIDLPGFGDTDKPLAAAYDAPFFARAVVDSLDALKLRRVHLIGHSLGGRVALEVAMLHPDRLASATLMTPSMAWRRTRRWAPYLRLVRPELGMIQPMPRMLVDPFVRRMVPGAQGGWGAIAVDEFLRSFLEPRGRAAFYAAARSIYLEDGDRPHGFWQRLARIRIPTLFIWGRRDPLVPAAFSRHVERVLPAAEHILLDSGHVPQMERPGELHAAIGRFLVAHPMRTHRAGGGALSGSPVAARR